MKEIASLSRLKALSDPTRIRILGLLEEEELSVRELTDVLGMAQSRVSGHLAVLRDNGFVQDRRQGTSAFYSMAESEAVSTWNAVRATMPETALAPSHRSRLERTLRARTEREREFFDRAAEAWDDERSESLGLHAGIFAAAGLLPRHLTVLDLGTGTGGLLPVLTRYVDRVIAVDMSVRMLSRARRKVPSRTVPSAELLRADVNRLPLPDASVDGVVANMILHHLGEPEALLAEMVRVLRPEGRGVIIDFESHDESWLLEEEGHRWPGFDPAQLGAWCVDAGLSMPGFQRVPTPGSGRWNRLEVFAARFARTSKSTRTSANGRGRN